MQTVRLVVLALLVLSGASIGAQTNEEVAPSAASISRFSSDGLATPRRPAGRRTCIDVGYPHEVLPGICEVAGLDVTLPYDDLAPLADIIGDAEVVGLGESEHTSGGYYRAKHRLFRYLVEELGFRAFAFESPWIPAELVREYVETCEGSSFDAVTEGLFDVWASQTTLDLVEWMCGWNQSHPDDSVAFWGFDIQQPWHDGTQLLNYLDDVGFDNLEIIEDIGRCNGVGYESVDHYNATPGSRELSEEDYLACLLALRRVEYYFDEHEAELAAATSAETLAWARINLIGLRAWQDVRIYYEENLAASIRARDQGMAAVFLAIKALRNPDDRVALWSHNWHVAYWAEDLEGWAPDYRIMGGYLRDELGDDYFALGLVGYEVSINWPGWHVGALELPADELHVEHKLHFELDHDYLLVDLDFPGTDEPFLVDGGFYYVNNRWVVPADHFGALLYLDTSEMMDALLW